MPAAPAGPVTVITQTSSDLARKLAEAGRFAFHVTTSGRAVPRVRGERAGVLRWRPQGLRPGAPDGAGRCRRWGSCVGRSIGALSRLQAADHRPEGAGH